MIGAMTKIVTISHGNAVFFAKPFQNLEQQWGNFI